MCIYSCFLTHAGTLWGAFLFPIIVVMVFNVVIFIWVIVVLVQYARRTAAQKKEAVSSKTIMHMTVSIAGVMSLFGLTWLLAILTFSVTGLRETFQILFTVFNSLQGFFIFLFVLNMESFGYWRELLSCEKCQSKWRHHNSQGTGTAAKKLQQNKTDFISPSGGKNASETSPRKEKDFELLKFEEMFLFEPKVNPGTSETDRSTSLTETAVLTDIAALTSTNVDQIDLTSCATNKNESS